MNVCKRLRIGQVTGPPARQPPTAGALVAGRVMDPVLASVYQRLGQAAFATESAGLVLNRMDDTVNELEPRNREFQESTQPGITVPLLEFAGESFLAYSYATAPELADERGHQPVVMVDRYEEPSVLPVASDVDAFFGTYASFLEALASPPSDREPPGTRLVFPWSVPEFLARDERLVAMLRAGKFDSLMGSDPETHDWVDRVLKAADSRLLR